MFAPACYFHCISESSHFWCAKSLQKARTFIEHRTIKVSTGSGQVSDRDVSLCMLCMLPHGCCLNQVLHAWMFAGWTGAQ